MVVNVTDWSKLFCLPDSNKDTILILFVFFSKQKKNCHCVIANVVISGFGCKQIPIAANL